MGVVYEAFDKARNQLVALKTLHKLDGPALYRFKNEFRSLVDISHPNLVTLYELICIDGEWLFTMELVDGVGFMDVVRPTRDGTTQARDETTASVAAASGAEFETVETSHNQGAATQPQTTLDLPRLRSALPQLAEAIDYLHRVGRLHRDIKPSNILVENHSQRIVLCDFGLIAQLSERDTYETSSDQLVGTLAYMSPEQAAGRPLSQASDWYSFGVVLYRCLTGAVPFSGSGRRILELKQTLVPPAPHSVATEVPADLDQLCVDLLRIDSGERPPRAEILRRLGATHGADTVAPAVVRRAAFVGRDRHLAELRKAYSIARAGSTSIAYVRGPSGMGKTALVRHFLDEVVDTDGALVFSGRCYQNEVLPYKAFDNLIDDLSSYLAGLDPAQTSALLPDDTSSLARLFPVLRRIRAVAEPETRRFGAPDPRSLRDLAFASLRILLGNMASKMPIVLFIDDLQWGDLDSIALLREVLHVINGPAVLLVATYRSEDEPTSPILAALRELYSEGHAVVTLSIDLLPLEDGEAHALAEQLMPDPETLSSIPLLVKEAGGSPLFLAELVRHMADTRAQATAETTDLDGMLHSRIDKLAASARELLSVIAVFGRPTPMALVKAVVNDSPDMAADMFQLERHNLIRRQGALGRETVEPYHDRVRESLLKALSVSERQGFHARVADAIEGSGAADFEALVSHWLAAGQRTRAAEAAIPAAEQAEQAFAFDRAVELYTLAIEQRSEGDEWLALRQRQADALANAGRGVQAAEAYLDAARLNSIAARILELEQRAAQAYLRAGHIDEGVSVLSRLLDKMGTPLATTPRRALFSLLTRRAAARLRPLRLVTRDESQVSQENLARVDVLWTAAVGLGMVDPIRGFDLQTRHLAMAVKVGEPSRLIRAMAIEVAYLAINQRGRKRAGKLLQQIQPLITSHTDELLGVIYHGIEAFAAYQAGEFRTTRDKLDIMLEWNRATAVGAQWELSTGQLYRLWALYYLGDIGRMTTLTARLRRESADRGDAYAGSTLRTGFPQVAMLLSSDSPATVDEDVRAGLAMWTKHGFHLQHNWGIVAQVHRDLYVGDGESAWRRTTSAWPKLKAGFMLRVDMVRLDSLHQRARAAIAAARTADNPARLLHQAQRDARAIARDVVPSMRAIAILLRAQIAAARGQDERAVAEFNDAAAACAAANLSLFAACARFRSGEIEGGDAGAKRRAEAEKWMRDHQVAAPSRAVDMLAPI